jgi:Na+-translocating ferredoxin:NAD+ oxidoreductase RNF subunit RnfB
VISHCNHSIPHTAKLGRFNTKFLCTRCGICIATWQTDSVKIRRIPVKVNSRIELTEKEKEELR